MTTRGRGKLLRSQNEGHKVTGSPRLAPAMAQRIPVLLTPTLISVNTPDDSDRRLWCFPSFTLF